MGVYSVTEEKELSRGERREIEKFGRILPRVPEGRTRIRKQYCVSAEDVRFVEERARVLGINGSQYVRRLIAVQQGRKELL